MKRIPCALVISAIPLDQDIILDIAKQNFLYARIDFPVVPSYIGALHREISWSKGFGLLGFEYAPLHSVTPEAFATRALTIGCPISFFDGRYDSTYRIPPTLKEVNLMLNEVRIIGISHDSRISGILADSGFRRISYNDLGCRASRDASSKNHN